MSRLACITFGNSRNASLFWGNPSTLYLLKTILRRASTEKLSKKDTSGGLAKVYVPEDVESNWYSWWEQNNFFKIPHDVHSEKHFTMILPPPNVTGSLHLGHALTVSIQDAIARWHHMHGRTVIWIPGTDHAGIATQTVVEKRLWTSRNLTRHDIGRNQFLQEVQDWQGKQGSIIQEQLRRMGAMLDWDREYFTLDKNQSSAVSEAFIQLFDEGLIYRSQLPVNWSCWLRSTVSDIEVENLDVVEPTYINVPGYENPIQFGTISEIAYKICGRDEEIVVTTTRPETMLGDVAVAVHPADTRYTCFHGCHLWHPYRAEEIPIICDAFVDPNFGSGAVKVTPAHEKIDFEVAKRHNLNLVPVINEEGNICDGFDFFTGMKRFDARESILNDLQSRGLLRNVREHKMVIPVCSRSGDVIEFILKPQWFLSTKKMAVSADSVVSDRSLQLIPNRMEKNWHQWFSSIQDWCLSRQLWWGHRIPVYKCYVLPDIDRSVWVAARNLSEAKSKASILLNVHASDSRIKAEQDEDVLDTWFSSSLLPFSVFGWPEKTEDLHSLYPISLMETGNDILFFWVARMVMLGLHFTKQLPFSRAVLHGIVCDSSGRKMSKSLGNVISPEDVRCGLSLKEMILLMEKSQKTGVISGSELQTVRKSLHNLFPHGIPACGTDALRFTLCANDIQSQFINFDVNECFKNRLFCNKIWQACRYVEGIMKQIDLRRCRLEDHKKFSVMDKWVLSCLSSLVSNVDQGFQEVNLHLCTNAFRTFAYDIFCDVYVESSKEVLRGNDPEAGEATLCVLATCLKTMLIILSPFMPFLSEELFQRMNFLKEYSQSIFEVPYPKPDFLKRWHNVALQNEMANVLLVVSAVRKLKLNNGFKMRDRVSVAIETDSLSELHIYQSYVPQIKSLAQCEIEEVSRASGEAVVSLLKERINIDSIVRLILVDETQRDLSLKAREGRFLTATRKRLRFMSEIAHLQKSMQSKYFLHKASEHTKAIEYKKLVQLEEELEKCEILLNQDLNLRDKFEQHVEKEKLHCNDVKKRRLEEQQKSKAAKK